MTLAISIYGNGFGVLEWVLVACLLATLAELLLNWWYDRRDARRPIPTRNQPEGDDVVTAQHAATPPSVPVGAPLPPVGYVDPEQGETAA